MLLGSQFVIKRVLSDLSYTSYGEAKETIIFKIGFKFVDEACRSYSNTLIVW